MERIFTEIATWVKGLTLLPRHCRPVAVIVIVVLIVVVNPTLQMHSHIRSFHLLLQAEMWRW